MKTLGILCITFLATLLGFSMNIDNTLGLVKVYEVSFLVVWFVFSVVFAVIVDVVYEKPSTKAKKVWI